MVEQFGDRLKRLRKAAGLAQVEVAAATGINRTFLSRMERQGVPTDWQKMCELADLYNVTLDHLRSGAPVPALQPSSDVVKDADERSLLRMWRAMNEAERRLIVGVAERLADRADPHDAA